jgi:hypothetical protein
MNKKNTILVLLALGLTAGSFFYFKNLQKYQQAKDAKVFIQKPEKRTEKNKEEKIGETVPFTVSGPGGCKSVEDCQNYCQANPQECISYETSTEGLSEENQIFAEPLQQPEQEQTGFESRRSLEECDDFYCPATSQKYADLHPKTAVSKQEEKQKTDSFLENNSLVGSIIQAFTDFFRY